MAVAFNWENHQDNSFDGPFTTFNVGSTDAAGANGSFTAGDILIARVTVINDAGDTIVPPAGWSAIGSQITDGANSLTGFFSHLCDGSESGSFTFSWTNSKFASWGLGNISGASSTLDAFAVASWNNAGGATFTTGSVTATNAGDILVLMVWAGGGANTIAAPGDMTSRANLTQMSGTGNYLLATRSPGSTGSFTEAFGVTNTFTDGAYALVALKPAGGAALVTGWDYIQDDIYPPRRSAFSSAPAFVSTFRTAPISGMAWQEPQDAIRLPPRVALSLAPAMPLRAPVVASFGFFAPLDLTQPKKRILDNDGDAPMGSPFYLPPQVSGISWAGPREPERLPKGKYLTDPVSVTYAPQIVTWAFSVGDTTFLRDPPVDFPPAYGRAISQAVGISGMAWFAPADRDRPSVKVTFEAPPAIALVPSTLPPRIAGMGWFEPLPWLTVSVKGADAPPAFGRAIGAAASTISGMAWFVPTDRDRPTVKVVYEAPPAHAITSVYVPAPVSGIAWMVQPEMVRLRARISDAAPAGVFTLQGAVFGGWFNEPDLWRRRMDGAENLPAHVLRSFAPPVGISGMAWFTPPDHELSWARPTFGKEPAFSFGSPLVITPTPPERVIRFAVESRTIRFGPEGRSISF